VAFVRRQHDHWEIYVVDADGRNPRRLTDTPNKPDGQVGNSVSPAWSPDGQYIAFLTDRTGKWEIWMMRANGSGQQPMFDTELAGLRLDYSFIGERAISWTK
jgi:Tol biopolymer transport system component